MPKKKVDSNKGWKIAGTVAATVACLAVTGFAGYGIYNLVDKVQQDNQQQEEVQTPEDNQEQTTPEEEIVTEALAQYGIR